ncbi:MULTISPECIES: hypothetical protein [Asaia]|uniref:Uncharacterized protein n=2 Tax=Asaia bogorensis TaxID=91915 RepID=A0AAN4U4C1_9PROT|nr:MULTISPECIES: hypothetical protein [Asaia]ETC97297.1 membrane protein [Asaia sp. SF2.1]MDL2170881.1 hypothetical protein [Asaia sp. HumB]MDR6183301.1 hypothetical protein [Asaia bogorensis NBRC 16594]NIE80887.1 hypothetical protein [Asaia sp. As-1742]CDG39058.1 hypothetical protein ASAP_1013 [Asaia bogorensis]
MKGAKLDNRRWLAKTLAGLIPGAALALGAMVLAGHLCGATGNPMMLSSQFLMWGAALLWVICLSLCFLFRSGLGAWFGLGWIACLLWLANTLLAGFFGGEQP